MANEKILIVEDESVVALDLRDRIKRLGYSISAVVASGEDAVRRAVEMHPDLILMDVRLRGEMDGIEAAEQIHARFDVPVIYLTASADSSTLQRAKVTQPYGYVIKPAADVELRAAIEIALAKHEMERRIRESERWLATTLRSIGDAVIASDPQGRIQLLNPVAEALTGWRQEQALGQDLAAVFRVVHEDTREPVDGYVVEALQGKSVDGSASDILLVAKDGPEIPIEINMAPILDDASPAGGVVLVFRDITERRRAEEALRRHRDHLDELVRERTRELTAVNERLRREVDERTRAEADIARASEALRESEETARALLNAPLDAAILTDTEGVVLDANETMSRRFGMRVDELVGTCIWDLLPPDLAERRQACIREVLRSGEPIRHEDERLGTWFDNVAFPIFDAQGKVTKVAALARDITERKQVEEALRRYAEEQAALYAVSSAVATLLEPGQVASVVLDVVLSVVDGDVGWVTVLDPTPGDPLRVVAHRGVPEALLAAIAQVPLGVCPFCEVMQAAGGEDAPGALVLDCACFTDEVISSADLHSRVCIPLSAMDRTWGALSVAWRAPRSYSEQDRALLIAIGQQAGLALHNARLYHDARRVDQLKVLNELDQALSSTLDLKEVVDVTLRHLAAALNTSRGALILYDPPVGGRLGNVLTLSQGWTELSLSETSVERLQALLQRLGHRGEIAPLSSEDLDTLIACLDPHLARAMGPGDLVTPIWWRHELIAVLGLGGRPADHPFTAEDRALVRAAAHRAGQAIQNAHLYSAARARADELAVLSEIGLALTATLDQAAVARATLSRVRDLFGATGAALLCPDPEVGELVLLYTLAGAAPVEVLVPLSPEEDTLGWVLAHHQPLLFEDAESDPYLSDIGDRYLGFQTRGLMIVPLVTQQRDAGLIAVSSDEPGAFTHDDLRTLRSLAPTLAVALENARLYDELKALLRERERAQAQLIQAEKMGALGRLTASIAHEINNPIQAVQTYLTLAEEELDGDQRREKLQRYVTTVAGEIDRVSTIVQRMRDFYRPSRAGTAPTDLHAVLESVLALTSKQMQHSEISVERAWADDLPMIQANGDQLRQVFLNLVLNAVDAMVMGGTLRVSTALDQMPVAGGLPPRRALRVVLSDTGEGVPPEDVSRLFEPFFTTKKRGSGLGLSISYGIVQSHGGEISVASQVGTGTTFTVLLPVGRGE